MHRLRVLALHFLALLIGLLLAVAAGEVLVRVVVPAETLWTVGKSNIYRAVPDPDIGYTYRPNLKGMGFGVDLRTNSLGFRGPEWSTQRADGMFRVVLIGDSHAFAFGVPFKDSIGEVLARRLSEISGRPAEVLNFGVNAYNSRQELAVFERYALRFNPDLVVIMNSSNDHEPANPVDEEGWMYRKRRSVNRWRRSYDKSIRAIEPGEFPRWMRHSHLALYVGIARERFRDWYKQVQRAQQVPSSPAGEWPPVVSGDELSERLEHDVYEPVRAMIRESSARGVPVVLSFYATSPDYRRMINRLQEEEGVPVVDLLGLFPEVHSTRELTVRFGLGWNPHLNADAHRRWGETIAEVIDDRGYLRDDDG